MGGLTAAMFLFLIASGLSLIFGVLRVLNFAHGSFYMLGAYIAWQVVHWVSGTAPGHFWLAPLDPRWRVPGFRHDGALLQSVHHPERAGDSARCLADADPHLARPDGARRRARPRDARRARRQCRLALLRHVHAERTARGIVGRAGD